MTVPSIMWQGAQPDPGGHDVDNALANAVALVASRGYGAVLAQLVEAPLDGVTVSAALSIESGGTPPLIPFCGGGPCARPPIPRLATRMARSSGIDLGLLPC
jgi:hypothetical protein